MTALLLRTELRSQYTEIVNRVTESIYRNTGPGFNSISPENCPIVSFDIVHWQYCLCFPCLKFTEVTEGLFLILYKSFCELC